MAVITDENGSPILDEGGSPILDEDGTPAGTVCWGHDTGVIEANVRNFTGKWAGTGTISGAGDSEQIELLSSEYEESETWEIGAGRIKITIDKYGTGSGTVVVKYKDGNSLANCEADSWHNYTGSYVSSGWVKVRIENV